MILVITVAGMPDLLDLMGRRGNSLLVARPGLHKDLGVVLQRKGFSDPHVLPVYGSCEMEQPELNFPNRPDHVFTEASTGFRVSPVGRGGATPLVLAEKRAALGPAVAGKKVVIMMSFTWFYRERLSPSSYAGNFSELQAIRIATSPYLGDDLRHRFAERMLDMPDSLRQHQALESALRRLQSPQESPDVSGLLERLSLRYRGMRLLMEDYACTFIDLVGEWRHPASEPIITPLPPVPERSQAAQSMPGRPKAWRSDDSFATMMAATCEWANFELLLDTLERLKAKPLVICMPLDGIGQDEAGVSPHARNTLYYERMADMCSRRGCAFECFPEQEHNPNFLFKYRAHISNQGWACINEVIDAFYHDRLPAKPRELAFVSAPSTLARPVAPGLMVHPVAPPPQEMAAGDTDGPLARGHVGKVAEFVLPGDEKLSFCWCPPGSFTMGSLPGEAGRDSDENAVPARISQGLWLAQTVCTQAQWRALKPLPQTFFKGDHLPLENVSWEQVQDYLKTLTSALHLPEGWQAALPTEAQWEHACRAGTTTRFSFGNTLDETRATCLGTGPDAPFTTAELRKTSEVASFMPNPWGLYDMHGNVWEWCADWYAPSLVGGNDPQGPATGTQRVLRGGSWRNFASHCRSASRNFSLPNVASPHVGFRPALVYQGKKSVVLTK